MTIKRVRLNEDVHERLLKIKEQTKARSLNDVILSLIIISEEFYINNWKLNVADKKILLNYESGRLVEIEVKK